MEKEKEINSEYAVVFHADGGSLEMHEIPKGRFPAVDHLSPGMRFRQVELEATVVVVFFGKPPKLPLVKETAKAFKALVFCEINDDSPRNNWHSRMTGDFYIVVKTKAQARAIMTSPAPLLWWI